MTSGQDAPAILAWHAGISGRVLVEVEGSTVSTSGTRSHGIFADITPPSSGDASGDLRMNIRDSTVSTSGSASLGIATNHRRDSDLTVHLQDNTVTTEGDSSRAIDVQHGGSGNFDLRATGNSIMTSGRSAYGFYANRYRSPGSPSTKTGDLNVRLEGGSITTLGEDSYAVYLYQSSGVSGNIAAQIQDIAVSTSGEWTFGIYARHFDTGDIGLQVSDSSIMTSGDRAYGILSWHRVSGDIGVNVQGSTITTSGEFARGIYGLHHGTGDVAIQVADGSIVTSGNEAHGIFGLHGGSGDIGVNVQGSTITTSGEIAHGIYALHQGTGDVAIQVADSSIVTSGDEAHGVFAQYDDAGSIAIELRDATVHASGLDAHGIRAGSFDADGVVHGSVGRDAEGYRRQVVTVNSGVRGGSGDAAGVFLVGGGRVVVGPHGRVGADSGVAVRAAGRGPDGQPGPLSVILALNDRRLQEVLDGRIVNEDGNIELVANGTLLFDGAAGATGAWAPNGVWDATARTVDGGPELIQAYAPRAALYESLPGLLLRLDAGAPVQHSRESTWAQVGYGTGSGEAQRSPTGASYDFDRIEARAGTSRAWGEFGGSLWLRHIQSEVKVDAPVGASELELHGVGAGVAAHWRRADGLEFSGELSLTDFDVDADSVRHGHLARDVGAELWQARLAAEYRLEQASGLTLSPRAWAWHAEADIDDFTDAVGAQVAYADESRTAIGLGLRAELAQSESLLYGSLDLERVFSGEDTAVGVSGQVLASESEKTRVWLGLGGRLWRGERVALRGGLRLGDPGGRNQEVSASVSISGHF